MGRMKMIKTIPIRPIRSILITVAASAWLTALALLAFAVASQSALGAPIVRNFTYVLGPRTYDVHLPPGKGPFPVVLNLHGGGSSSKVIAVQSGMNANADRNGYAVVYPNGVGGTWNAGICCGVAMQTKVDDVAYIGRVLDDLPKRFSVDKSRIYVTGMSNGAMMAYRLAVESPQRFAAIGAVSTTMGMDVHAPHPPMSIIEIHGLKDPNAPFNGGVGPNAQPQPGGPPNHHAVMDTVAQWAPIDGYSIANPVDVRTLLDTKANKPVYTESIYVGTHATFHLYALTNGGHTWPGGVDVTAGQGTGELIKSLNANEVMWQFFAKWKLSI